MCGTQRQHPNGDDSHQFGGGSVAWTADLGLAPTGACDRGMSAPAEVVHEPPSGVAFPDLRKVYRARELLYFLTWRDVKVRYKQTVIGAGWAILQPVLTMVIFTLVFSRLAKLNSEGVPYPVFAYAALVPWTYFATATTQAGGSLVSNERLITKVFFPRLIIPLAAVAAVMVDLVLSAIVLVALLLGYGIAPGIGLLLVPAFIIVATLTAAGTGMLLAALNVRYRDVRYVIPFVIQLWLFITPVAYSADLVPGRWRYLYSLNPMVGVIKGFRWAFVGGTLPGWELATSVWMSVVILVLGLFVFRRFEDTFADEI